MDVNQKRNYSSIREKIDRGSVVLIVLVGLRGAGKTTLLNHLNSNPVVEVLTPSTTRKPRSKKDNEYDFVGNWGSSKYAWEIPISNEKYGLRKTEVEKAKNHFCVTVFDPLNIETFKAAEDNLGVDVVTIGLDTIDSIENQAARVNNDPTRIMSAEDFEKARNVVQKCDIVFNGSEASVLSGFLAVLMLQKGRGGILVEKDLRPLIQGGSILRNVDMGNVKGASYDLRLGDDVWCQGTMHTLTDENSLFEIPPYSYAIVIAKETAFLPTFIAANFDIKVSSFLEGIILSNGPQVDPGYRGKLFCMLFNGGSQPTSLVRNNHFATIQFITTTSKTPPYEDHYNLQTRLDGIMNAQTIGNQGGQIMKTVAEKFDQIEEKIKDLPKNLITGITIFLSIVGILGTFIFSQLYNHFSKKFDALSNSYSQLQKDLDYDLKEMDGDLKETGNDSDGKVEKPIEPKP